MAGTCCWSCWPRSNVASLLLARGAARAREVVTRIALGASRGRITTLLLIESMMVSLRGGLLGILAAPVVSAALLSFLPQDIARVSLTTAPGPAGSSLFALLVSLAPARCAARPGARRQVGFR